MQVTCALNVSLESMIMPRLVIVILSESLISVPEILVLHGKFANAGACQRVWILTCQDWDRDHWSKAMNGEKKLDYCNPSLETCTGDSKGTDCQRCYSIDLILEVAGTVLFVARVYFVHVIETFYFLKLEILHHCHCVLVGTPGNG